MDDEVREWLIRAQLAKAEGYYDLESFYLSMAEITKEVNRLHEITFKDSN